MNIAINGVRRNELNNSQKQRKQLTGQEKQHNIRVAESKLFWMVFENLLKDGGLQNAN